MIARTWHGRVPTGKADDYFTFLLRTGIAEYRAFQQAASAAGLLVWPVGWGDPVGLGAEAKGIIEIQKALAEVGVPLLQEWKSRLDGTTVTMRVTEISADPIPDDTFAVPAGYTKK